jgi:hypothetical protein
MVFISLKADGFLYLSYLFGEQRVLKALIRNACGVLAKETGLPVLRLFNL